MNNSITQPSISTNRFKLVAYSDEAIEAWENMISASLAGTFLHSRKFLSYHGNKFKDQSLLVYDDNEILRAVFPAAQDPANDMAIVSHPGITYGSLLHDGWLYGQRCLDALTQICESYRANGFKEIIYKAMPSIYQQTPVQDDIYALFRLGANRYRVDLSTAIDLEKRLPLSERRIRSYKKALKKALVISEDFVFIDKYWQMLADNLKNKHGKQPVHSLAELQLLKEKFPNEIELITALDGDEIVAGTLLFYCPTLIHAQYFASNTVGRESGALDIVIEKAIGKAKFAQKRFFDFGISTDLQGSYLNNSLYTFKSEFGACGSTYEFYRIKL